MNEMIKVRISIVLNGESHVFTNNIKIPKESNIANETRKLKTKLTTDNIRKLMNKYSLKINEYGNPRFLNNICGDCKNMTKCPKVLDKEKKSFKYYPYVSNGIEIEIVNLDKEQDYLNALFEYHLNEQDPDYDLNEDFELLERLNNNGKEVASITVYNCSKFVDDNRQDDKPLINNPYVKRY